MEWLYKRTASGKIQSWKGQTSIDLDFPQTAIIVTFGQLNGKFQEIITIISEGKQKRNHSEQAEFELKALYNSKQDEGYKSLNDLDIWTANDKVFSRGNRQGEEKSISHKNLEEALLYELPINNTDAKGNIKPMLAQPIKNDKKDNWHKVKYPVAGEPKLDGVRCLIFSKLVEYKEGTNLEINALSREGKSYNFGTALIREKLKDLFRDNSNIILDGELYVHGMPQNKISGAMRKGEYIPEIHDKIEYHVYDVINPNNTSINYATRKTFLEQLSNQYPDAFTLVNYFELSNKEEVDRYELMQIENGYEGIMLKNFSGTYEIGKRSYNNLKVKQFEEEEFEIVDFELGKRGSEDIVFILLTNEKNKQRFKAKLIGNRELKEKYYHKFIKDKADLEAKNIVSESLIIGKKATVKFKFYSEYGIPNHAQVKCIRDYE